MGEAPREREKAPREQRQEKQRTAQEKEGDLLRERLEGHYTHMKNFIRTQTEPTIFFLPIKHNKKTEGLLDQTRMAIDQKILSLKTHLQIPPDFVSQEEDVDVSSDDNAGLEKATDQRRTTPMRMKVAKRRKRPVHHQRIRQRKRDSALRFL